MIDTKKTKEYFIPALALEYPKSIETASQHIKIRNALIRFLQHNDFFSEEPIIHREIFIKSSKVSREPLGYLVEAVI